ncbi:MAG: calcium/sodium antiporter [Muribaculaceae bacterium]|nr:calcium/sodium antiporter [Muribaculaceae bacterium]MBQ4006382.1 calcium/sodium antiporter [Muribaculaceae bacterium]
MDYLFLIVGLGLLLLSADYLVDSSVAIAQRAKISNFIIGLTIVGMGTSAPELFVGVKSALAGDGDIAMGNVIGSNIANVLLILGVAGMILPFDIERTTIRRDIPFGIGAAALLFLVANDKLIPGIQENTISRVDAVFFLVLFVCYMGYVVVQKGKDPQKALSEADEETKSKLAGKHPALLWFIALVSLVGLIGGGNLFLDAAKKLATDWGMSEAVISITIVAVGTSLPELITAVVAACKNNPQLALGNVIGSNVFNILFILGVSGCVKPLNVVGVHLLDYAMMLGAAVLTAVVAFTFKRDKFDRIEGFIFLTLYITYTVFLFIR